MVISFVLGFLVWILKRKEKKKKKQYKAEKSIVKEMKLLIHNILTFVFWYVSWRFVFLQRSV